MIQSLGILGYGHFGAFLHMLAKRFLPGVALKIYARRQQPDGVLFYSLADVAACDAVLLAVPIGAYARVLDEVRPLLGPGSILIDVATVKKYTNDLVREAAAGRPFLALHPMFGPESYAKRGGDLSGFRIVITESTLPADGDRALRARLDEIGFAVLDKSADEHDKELAETLFLTHYIGQIVHRGGFERTTIDTVSFGFLMDAVDSVRHDKDLFEEVFRFNPYCKRMIDRFIEQERQVRSDLLGHSED